jgi:beta-ribofuranosylaminobenzene 5'-phosphate synthase
VNVPVNFSQETHSPRAANPMPGRIVQVFAPSRLHFGMFSFGQPGVRQFGGVGMMIRAPGLRLKITPAEKLCAVGPFEDLLLAHAQVVQKSISCGEPLACRLELTTAPRAHVGLGSGTQLALAVAAGLNAFCGGSPKPVAELARIVGRGKRSAIGTYGFAHGGLLVEAGKTADDEISPLVARVELPAEWRVVLICPRRMTGLSGEAERIAFERLPPVPVETTERLCREVLLELLPAAVAGDFEHFSDALYRFGHAAGMCFAGQQCGAFASDRIHTIVRRTVSLGARGVGQSSWGPSVFAVLPNVSTAESFVERFRGEGEVDDLEITVVEPDNRGAQIDCQVCS